MRSTSPLTSITNAGDTTTTNVAGTGTSDRLAKWLETGGAGTLGDSAITESGGKVGIGTTTPVRTLSIGGSTKPTPMTTNYQHFSPNAVVGQGLIGWNYSWNGSALVRQDTSFTAIRFAANPANSNVNTSFFAAMSNLAGTDQTVFTATLDATGAVGIFNANHRLAAGAGNTSAFTPLSSVGVRGNVAVGTNYAQTAAPANGAIFEGDVGVGTASPQSRLHVAGDLVLVATTGRVKVRVDARGRPVRIGDLLVTSGREGVAMRSRPVRAGGAVAAPARHDHRQGAGAAGER